MKAIVLSALLAIALIQVVEPATKNQRLRCHACMSPPTCKIRNEVECRSDQDTCQRTHMPITDPSGNENRNNYYASTSEGIIVLERLCTTKKRCENAKKRMLSRMSVDCCQGPLCNS
ncbi:uncharacterized protein [Aquarana catesbeiana]|uniref:uncharacterized protein isoform X4 n=1 Tax=Aquarana catesbeiana TaxID=8400 RepID=UPI003CCA1948